MLAFAKREETPNTTRANDTQWEIRSTYFVANERGKSGFVYRNVNTQVKSPIVG